MKKHDELKKLLERRSLELHVKEVREKGNKTKLGEYEYKLSDFDTQKNEKLEKLGNVKYNDIEDLVYRMLLTYGEIIEILDFKSFPTKRTGFSLHPGIFEVVDLNNTLKNILPNIVKVSVTIDDVRVKSSLKMNQTLIFTEISFFIRFYVLFDHVLIL